MGTLNPNLLSKHASLILNESAKIMPTVGKRLLMPEIVLLGLIRTPDTSARRILDKVAQERGFKLSDLDAATVAQLKTREGRPADFVFVLDNGGKIDLSDELLQSIDEALTIQLDLAAQLQAAGEVDAYVFEELALLYDAKREPAEVARYRELYRAITGG